MKPLISILLLIACLVIIPSQAQAQDTIPADSKNNTSWQMTCDSVSLVGRLNVSLQPDFDIYSPMVSKDKLYFSLNVDTRLQHYGSQMGDEYYFYISPNGKVRKTSKYANTPRSGFIPLTQTDKWEVNYFDVGEWGNYLSFIGSDSEYVFYQSGLLRALFVQDSAFLSVSQSRIARIADPASGRLMTQPKSGDLRKDSYLYYDNGASEPDVLWTTNAFLIDFGIADTIIRGAFMVEDQLMLAMSIRQHTGIYAFDGQDFRLEYDLGSLSLQDNYSTLQNQLLNPDGLLMVFEDANHRQGIMQIKGRSIHLTYLLFPDRPLPVTSTDPTIPMIKAMVGIKRLTMSQVDSIERSYGGVAMDDYQYFTLLSDKSYLARTYIYDKSTGLVEYVQIERSELTERAISDREWEEWQDAIVAAFGGELAPVESTNTNFVIYDSPRFRLWVCQSSHDNILVYFHNHQP